MDALTLERLKRLSEKSCCSVEDGSISMASNPNLEKERVSMEFISLLKDMSSLFNDVTFIDRAECKGEIPRFDSCGISAAGACATSCLPGSQIEDSYITYDMEKYKVSQIVKEDMLQCNKLGRSLTDYALGMLMTKMKNNMELAAIMGDEDLPTGDNQSAYNNLMGPNNGWLKLALNSAPEAQIIDAGGMGPSWQLYMAARKALPPRYRKNRANYRFIGGPSQFDWWASDAIGRETAAGDRARETGEGGRILGNSFYEVPQWPEDLPYGNQEASHILFTPLNNLIIFQRRQIEIETERRIACDDYQSVGWFSLDFAIAEPEALVLVKNVDFSNCDNPWVGCGTTGKDCGTIGTETHNLS